MFPDLIMFHIKREKANEFLYDICVWWSSLFWGHNHFSFGSFMREFLKKENKYNKWLSYWYLDALKIVDDSTWDELRMEPHEPNTAITSRKT
jgi:hypothetical protein